MERCPSSAAIASRRIPRLMAWVASVWRSWWGWTWPIPAWSADGGDDAVHGAPVDRVRGDRRCSRRWAADVFGVGGGPLGEEVDEVGVQGDEAVVAELADRDAEPVGVADLGDGVGGELAELAGA